MHQEEKPAYIIAMAACAMAEIAGMQAANQISIQAGVLPIYGKGDFDKVSETYGIHHNAVIGLLHNS